MSVPTKVITVDKGGKAVVDEVLQHEWLDDIRGNPRLEKIEKPETRPDLFLSVGLLTFF
jgi:hypothetical protein